jgi:hypothetical protein
MTIKIGLENIVEGEMKGLQFGFKNVADRIKGAQVGGWNETKMGICRTDRGLQLSYFLNGANIFYGAQVNVLFNICERLNGVQAGLFNMVDDHGRGKAKGVQIGGLNISDNMNGVQIGLENTCSGYFSGVQIGLLICEADEGNYLQVGLWNRKKGDPWYKGIPFLRCHRGGIKKWYE